MEKQPNSRMCFVCGIENPIGLKLKFYADEEGRCIARFRPKPEHQGFPGQLHRGIISTLLFIATGLVSAATASRALRCEPGKSDHGIDRKNHNSRRLFVDIYSWSVDVFDIRICRLAELLNHAYSCIKGCMMAMPELPMLDCARVPQFEAVGRRYPWS